MPVKIAGLEFEGPYYSTDRLQPTSGVYAVLDDLGTTSLPVVDVGEASNVRNRVENHDRKLCWARHRRGTWAVAAYYTLGLTEQQRRAIEKRVRDSTDPPCGSI